MDEFKEMILVWAIALVLMAAGVGVAHYATEDVQLSVDASAAR